jgi:hypothetical protein
MIPFDILLERLKQYDEVQILELLDLASEDLIELCVERIRQRRAYITKELELMDPADAEADDGDEEDTWN